MPPLRASGGATIGPTPVTPSPAALGRQARTRLAQHLAADPTFRKALLHKLNVIPFRGIVTAVNRDATGTNQVKVQRTGQTHADAGWYDVFAPKTVPIAGDEVLLEYVSSAPTAMVTQTRRGGRPDEEDVPYSGGSRRRYDSARALMHKHRDDHNSAHFRSDGVTVAHHKGEAGDAKHIGDHYHNAGAIHEDGTFPSATAYHRHTHQSGRYEHRYNDATNPEWLVNHHNHAGDHGFYNAGDLMVQHIGSGNGAKTRHRNQAHTGYHEHGDDGSGNWLVTHASGQKVHLHDGNNLSLYATGGSEVAVYHATQKQHRFLQNQHQVLQHGSTTLFHQFGDDLAGNAYIGHASGQKALQHDGNNLNLFGTAGSLISAILGTQTQHKFGANQHFVLQHGSTTAFHTFGDDLLGSVFIGHGNGQSVLRHDGSNSTLYTSLAAILSLVNGAQEQHRFTQNQHLVLQQGSTTAFHQFGDSGAGHAQIKSQGSSAYVQVSAGASAHQWTADGHTHPSGAQENAPSTDSSRVNVLSGSGGGGLKATSHSLTTGVNVTGPYTIAASPTGGLITAPGGIAPSGGLASSDNYFFKMQSVCIYRNTDTNPGVYKHGGTNSTNASGWGTGYYEGGVPSSNAYWSSNESGADGALLLWGVGNGASKSANVAVKYQIVNP